MAEITKVALDAMGGDNAPAEIVKGAVDALSREKSLYLFLVGREDAVKSELSKYDYDKERLEIVPASEVIEMAEPPVNAIRRKKDSSIVVGMKLVREGKADAFVSAGSTGAVLVGGQVIVGRIKGVERPPLAPLFPTENGVSLLIDCGANVDARPSHLVQFAKMGSIYMEHVVGVKDPKVGIVNIGAEEEKGNTLVKETFPLLKAEKSIHFIGSVEARDIPRGTADVIVCEAFDDPECKAMLVNGILERFPEKIIVSASGMAGYGQSNEIRTRKIGKNFYLCGDGVSDSGNGMGLMAPRVAVCAGHEANLIAELLIDGRNGGQTDKNDDK
ncbi:phosphate acyltransferase PlsX [Mordavella massiliensis]|nr:phosphate acyltransferase PlsX [Mordavella massiliensis]